MEVEDALIFNFCIVGDSGYNKFLFTCYCVFFIYLVTEVFYMIEHKATFQVLFLFKYSNVFLNRRIFVIIDIKVFQMLNCGTCLIFFLNH